MAVWFRSSVVVLAMIVVGLLGAWQASGLVSHRGGLGPTVLQALSPPSAVLAMVMTVGISSLICGFLARLTTTATGMFVLGFSLFILAMNLQGVQEFVLSGGSVNVLILEAGFVGLVVLLGTLVVFAIGGPMHGVKKSTSQMGTVPEIGMAALISITILPVIWIFAQTPMKGQVIGSVFIGGIVIGFLTRKFLPSTQPILLFGFPIFMAGIGYLIAMSTGVVDAISFTQQTISTLLFPMPIDYAAGSVMGVSFGLGWASSFAESDSSSKEQQHPDKEWVNIKKERDEQSKQMNETAIDEPREATRSVPSNESEEGS